MGKDAYYFPHDFYAREDPKLQKLLMKHGLAGIGAYWCIVEMIYEQGGICRNCDLETIAFGLHCDTALLESVLTNFRLFEVDNDGNYFSASANARNARRAAIAEQRSAAGKKGNEVRWHRDKIANASESVANATKNHRKTSQGKERKEKETPIDKSIAVKESKEKSFELPESFIPIVEQWLSYKRSRGESYRNSKSIELMQKKLIKFSGGDVAVATEIIEEAMSNNWSGFFAPKNNSNSNGSNSSRRNPGISEDGYKPDYSKTTI